MKVFLPTVVMTGVLVCSTSLAQLSASGGIEQQSVTPLQVLSPAQQRIDVARRHISADPKRLQSYNDLATAYLSRARESADPRFLKDAQQTLDQSLAIDGGDFSLQKTQVAIMLARHQFTQAKVRAAELNRRTPDDVMTYGYLAEADLALGDYPEAEKSIQWMMNMLPNNRPALLLGARLRAIYGDPEGALEFLNLAFSQVPAAETEELAYIANQIASVQIDAGKADAAQPVLERAEKLFPYYWSTTENLARVRIAQHRPKDAVTLLTSAAQIDPDPHELFLLAEAQTAAGQSPQASTSYAVFESRAGNSAIHYEDAACDLVLLKARSSATVRQALTLAESERKTRHDVSTLDAYAWALHQNGRSAEAEAVIQKAIALGAQSAQIFNHAGHIARQLQHLTEASRYFELSMRAEPTSDYASDSRDAIGLPANPAGRSKATAEPTASMPPSSVDIKPITESAAAPLAGSPAFPPAFSAVPLTLLVPQATGTDRMIRKAQATLASNPKDASSYAALGAAYLQRARETGDVNDYQLAEESITRSLDLDSADFSAVAPLQTMAEVCMGEHRFDDALTYAQKALALGSGDQSPFAIIGDADADKGEYDRAEADYARLAIGSSEAVARTAYARDSRVSYLKFISGDTSGALRLMKVAVSEGVAAELPRENLAWLYYELGEYATQAGDIASADSAYLAALGTHPGDYRALAALARLRSNEGRYQEAVVLYEKAIAVVPMPIFVAELGDLYAKMGNETEARKQYQLVEYIGLLGHINQVLHNRDLALFYADHDIKLDVALELAHKEFEVRHDIYTWDALAWALFKNGRFGEAAKASERALQSGTRDPLLLYHAGMIAEKLGKSDEARKELKEALVINPHFHMIYADRAQQQLSLLESRASSGPAEESHAP
ncbi:MAG TPA: tetratricopeptide repeat protein [Acidisarcina sp.]